MPDDTPNIAHAREAGLRYVTGHEPGIRRERDGAKFRYVGADGEEITDEAELARIRKLAIPPAYEDVWICVDAHGHLQATGYDARRRKQYRYHPQWRAVRDGAKFDRMIEFGEALPKLRRKLRRDLALPGLPQDKVLAVVVALLDSTLVRVGNPEYARDNQSYGLTTLRDRHAKFIPDGRALLKFRGKGGQEHEIVVKDRRLAMIVRHCQQLPGQHLFQYVGDDGVQRPIDSGQVNAYLASAMGRDFTAKDFRTWGATVRALALMSCTPLQADASDAHKTACIVSAVKQVAAQLRNTPAVCRKSYINPSVFEAWREGRLHKLVRDDLGRAPQRAEKATLIFLRAQARRARNTSARAARSPSAGARRARRASRAGISAIAPRSPSPSSRRRAGAAPRAHTSA
ncbi:MAG TPA: DNA topoisomerase IB [Nevskiaceae bacterium]|nr:DNA topoisomerase IB [Nevskiaceae bacterium]